VTVIRSCPAITIAGGVRLGVCGVVLVVCVCVGVGGVVLCRCVCVCVCDLLIILQTPGYSDPQDGGAGQCASVRVTLNP